MNDDPRDGVGYKRPPSHTRFRPGRSGNPGGRPKRRPSFRAALLAELAATMPAEDQQRAGSKLQALVKTLVDCCDRRRRARTIHPGRGAGAHRRIEENEPDSLTSGRPGNSRRLRGRRAQASRQRKAKRRHPRARAMRTDLLRYARIPGPRGLLRTLSAARSFFHVNAATRERK